MKQITFNEFGWTLTFKVYKDRRGLVSYLVKNNCSKSMAACCLSVYRHSANILQTTLVFEEGHLGGGTVSHEIFHAVCRHMEAAELIDTFTRKFWNWWLDE